MRDFPSLPGGAKTAVPVHAPPHWLHAVSPLTAELRLLAVATAPFGLPGAASFRDIPRATTALPNPQLGSEGEKIDSGYRSCPPKCVNKVQLGNEEKGCYLSRVTLKQHIHELVDKLPDNSPLLIKVRETLRMNRALSEASDDMREGRTFTAGEFTAKVQERWPRKASV